MKKTIFSLLIIAIVEIAVLYSCSRVEINKPPNAVAGSDQFIILPTDSASLDGSASNDPNGAIIEWLWKKIEGPSSYAISNARAAKTVVKNLDSGVYRFELMVKDDGGLSSSDTVQIIVGKALPANNPPANSPPVANAGTDQTITLPLSTVTLDGIYSTDRDFKLNRLSMGKNFRTYFIYYC